MRRICCLGVACVIGMFAAATLGSPDDAADRLLDGVEAIATGGNPSTLIVGGPAEPLVVAPDGRVFAACATLYRDRTASDANRVVALGHGGYFGDRSAGTPAFLANAVQWVAGAGGRDPEASIRIGNMPESVGETLAARGVKYTWVGGSARDLDLGGVDVLFASPQAWEGAGRYHELREWVMSGGGLIAAECAWGQLQLKRAESAGALACNRLLAPFGIMWTEHASSPIRDGVYPVDRDLRLAAHTGRAIGKLLAPHDHPADKVAFASRVVAEALAIVPLDHALVRDAMLIREMQGDALAERYRQIDARPLTPKDDPLAYVLIDLDSRLAQQLPPDEIEAHASAEAFPGLHEGVHPEKAPIGKGFQGAVLETAIPGWRSTGLWAGAGEQISLVWVRSDGQVGELEPLGDAGAELTVQIGCWLDPQQFDQRVRLRSATRRFTLGADGGTIASAIGGPIYVDIPPGLSDKVGAVAVVATGAREMPRFRLGHTDLNEWRDRIRHVPAPWAELESDELVITLPADYVRGLDRPDLVMEHWDRVHAAMQSLEPRTDNHWADRQYRYVCDARLSWGYMYCPANAPIVIPISAGDEMLDLENFDAEGPNRLWGHYHEMGHAHQNPMWTFAGTGEVTVNIFTVYALHTVNGYPLDSEVMRSNPKEAWERFEAHQAEGAPFEKWKRDPFLALQAYAMLWHAFGFDAFHSVFDTYRALPAGDRPRGDDAERDLFMEMFSREVGRDLSGYFRAWGVPISDEAAARVAELPDWSPEAPR